MKATTTDRDRDVVARYADGETLDAIGQVYGITRERIRQIVKKSGGADAQQSRRARQAANEIALSSALEAFLDRFIDIATALAQNGYTRAQVVSRISTLFPDVDSGVADEALAQSRIIFDTSRGENVFSDAVLMAGLWYLLGSELSLSPDPEWAAVSLEQDVIDDVRAALTDATVDERDVATILGLIGATRRHALKNPTITITGARYGLLRGELLDALGLVSDKGSMPWPPSRQTVMKRFGGWNEALLAMGIETATRGRPKGLVQFEHSDYRMALIDFCAESKEAGVSPTAANYGVWASSRTAAGDRRPSAASIRNYHGTWLDAMRSAGSPVLGGINDEPGSEPNSASANLAPSDAA